VRDHPDDAAAQVAWLKLLLEDGSAEQAPALASRIVELSLPPVR